MNKRSRSDRWLLPLVLTAALPTATHAIDPDLPYGAISYQGFLKEDSAPANGLYSFQVSLWDVAAGGVASNRLDFITSDSPVADGLFVLGIGASHPMWSQPEGALRFLELAVRPAGSTGPYTTLTPRQRLTHVPYALHSEAAKVADAALTLTGFLPLSNLPPAVARLDVAQTFTAPPVFAPTAGPPFVVGVTSTVQQLSADKLDGLDSTNFARRSVIGGVAAIIDPEDRPLELHIQNTRVLRLEKGLTAPNLIGGSSANTITSTASGSVIAGGGALFGANSIASHGAFVGAGRGNTVRTGADYATLAGGDGNEIGGAAYDATIGGGARQLIGPNSVYAGIFAGYNNQVSTNSRFAGVLLGNNGKVRENSDFSMIVAGDNNAIGPQAAYAAIISGGANRIESGANFSLIASGQQNVISTQAVHSAIVSGQLNKIHNGAQRSFLGGGTYNEIGPASYNAFLGGGDHNKIEFNAPYSAILAGNYNLVRSNAGWSTVLGGVSSVAGAPFAIAAGHQARAEHAGSIVLADGQYADFASSNANEFAVRAFGGVRLETGGRGVWVDGQRLLPGDPGGGGAGTNTITAPFTLSGDEPGRSILRGVNESPTLLSTGVRGEATAPSGTTIGVFGLNASSDGTAVYGLASRGTGVNYALRGETESAEGYAGFFEGRVHIQGGTDVEPLTGGFLQIGASSGANLALDDNELMARNNGEASTLYLNDDGGNVLLARNGTGRVGIGVAAPTVKLDVGGEIRCVALTLTSSRRFKTDIVPLENALDRVNALRGVTYRWDQAHGGMTDVGFVAEEVEPVLPEAVVREPDGQTVAGIKADRLTALTVEAVKELHQVVRAKDAEIAELRARLTDIERRLGLGDPPAQPASAVAQHRTPRFEILP